MVPKQDARTIVLVGFWNRMIFTPEWVASHLFDGGEIEKLVSILPVAPVLYRDGCNTLSVEEQRIAVVANKSDDKCLQRTESIARECLRLLEVTPVSGVGVNFGFVEQSPDPSLLKVFNASDQANIAASEWELETRVLTRKLTKGDEVLNFSLTYDGTTVELGANFHSDVSSAKEAGDRLEDRVVGLRASLLSFLDEVYGLQLTEEAK